jgi:tetratricopeptide (TPR) repeat protein
MAAALWSMYVDSAKSRLLAALKGTDRDVIAQATEGLEAVAGPDGESWFLLAWMHTADPLKRLPYFERAVELAPSTRHLRGLAQAQVEAGNREDALKTLQRALLYDPNNYRTLMQQLRLFEEARETAKAKETAERIVAIEGTDYMRTRALAELVPTEFYEARVFLAKDTTDRAQKAMLLREAALGYARYHAITVPKIFQFERQNLDFLGETRQSAARKLEEGRKAAEEAAEIYSDLGDSKTSEELRELARGLTLD